MIKMPNNQAAGQDGLELVELNLMLGEPQEGTALSGQLAKGHSMVLKVRHKKGELVTQPEE